LWIKDNQDREVLNVRLLNPTSLRIEGVFNLPYDPNQPTSNRPYITISKDALTTHPENRVDKGNCSGFVREGLGVVAFGYRSHQ
jgi:hypothetical protein